jgi:hypothetical protein
MRARTKAKEDANFAAFHATATRLRAQGHDVVNPAENFGGSRDLPIGAYFCRDTHDITECDAVALLPNWRWSRGALFEVVVALRCGKLVVDSDRCLVILGLTLEWAVARLLALEAKGKAHAILSRSFIPPPRSKAPRITPRATTVAGTPKG